MKKDVQILTRWCFFGAKQISFKMHFRIYVLCCSHLLLNINVYISRIKKLSRWIRLVRNRNQGLIKLSINDRKYKFDSFLHNHPDRSLRFLIK